MKKLIIILTLFLGLSAILPIAALAQTATPKPTPIAGEQGLVTMTNQNCYKTGDCTLCDVLEIVNNIIRLILGLVGAAALIAFVYGGFQLMFKGAEVKAFSKGKETIKYAFFGLLLVFFSYSLVNFGLNLVVVAAGKNIGDPSVDFSATAVIFKKPWNAFCSK